MRIRFFNTYEPVTTFYRDLLPALAQDGNQVEVYISAANYRSGRGPLARALRLPGLRIRSFATFGLAPEGRAKKGWIMFTYSIQAALASLLAGRADLNVFLSQPPLFAVWGSVLKALRGQRYFCVIMDLYPEAAVRDGLLREGGPAARILTELARFAWRHADGLVVIGRCQRERLLQAGIAAHKIHFIPNWAGAGLVQPIAASRNTFRNRLGLGNSFVVLYSGNMGVAHDFLTLIGAAERLRGHPEIRFVLIGDGPRRAELRQAMRSRALDNLTLLPFQPAGRLAQSMSLGDIHIVTLRDGFEGVVVPSKAYAAQAAGRPLIYVGQRSGEIARMVGEGRIGTVVAAGDAEGLARAILKYARDRAFKSAQGKRALALYHQRYHPRHALGAYRELLKGMIHDR